MKPHFRDFESGIHNLEQIETDWTVVHEPAHLVMCYASAIQKHFAGIIKDLHESEEAAQEFFLWVYQNGLPRAKRERGRFRDYLKAVVRNAAYNHLQRKRPPKHADSRLLEILPDNSCALIDKQWVVQWRKCLLNRAWLALKKHEQESSNNFSFTVLRTSARHRNEDSKALALRVSQCTGRVLSAESFRKQVSRGRRLFAEFLLQAVSNTLDNPTAEQVEEELVDLKLMSYVRNYLPANWRTSGTLSNLK